MPRRYKNTPLVRTIAAYKARHSSRTIRKDYMHHLLGLASEIAQLKSDYIDLEPLKAEHYVYVYLDTRKPKGRYKYVLPSGKRVVYKYPPLYVGKGKANRFKTHLTEKPSRIRNSTKTNVIRKVREATGADPIIKVTSSRVSDFLAQAFEIDLIAGIGRRDLGTGPLANLTDGGEGGSGSLMTKRMRSDARKRATAMWAARSDEERAAIGRKVSEGHASSIKRELTEEERQKRSARMRGFKHSTQTIQKMRANAAARDPSFYKTNFHSPAARQKAALSNKGKPSANRGKTRTEAHKEAIRQFQTGRTRSEETRRKMSETKRRQNLIVLVCPHCRKSGKAAGMKSSHFDNCKYRS